MKKSLLLIILVWLSTFVCHGQKKYEMVVEKTDGTDIVINTEDIVRTFFRERNGGDTPDPGDFSIVGIWYVYEADQQDIDGIWTFNSDNTGTIKEFHDGNLEEEDKMTYTFSGNTLTIFLEGEEDNPLVFNINIVSPTEFTWTDGHDTLTFIKQDSQPPTPQTYLTCPDSNHPHMIDLGLPSHTKWACCNVGANFPEDYGSHYAWGETSEKDTYDWTTYTHCDGTEATCHNIGSDIAGTQYDVAHEKWGGTWQMPSFDQNEELINNCTSEYTTLNGVNGRKFVGPNGGSIFLPAAGFRSGANFSGVGDKGYYWSSTQHKTNPVCAYLLDFGSGSMNWNNSGRFCGGPSVRPVSK